MAIKVRMELEDITLTAEVMADGRWHGKIDYIEFRYRTGSLKAELVPGTVEFTLDNGQMGAILALAAGIEDHLADSDIPMREAWPVVKGLYALAEPAVKELPREARPIP